MTRDERIDRARSSRRTFAGWTPPPKERDRHGIGGNNPPDYDPDAPVTGFPMVLRDIDPMDFGGDVGVITSRSGLRQMQRERGVEQVGLEWTGSQEDGQKPWFWDEYKENRREREQAAKTGKAAPEPFVPSKSQNKPEMIRHTDVEANEKRFPCLK